jgi:DNA-binding beta-propeller fold protein YncE
MLTAETILLQDLFCQEGHHCHSLKEIGWPIKDIRSVKGPDIMQRPICCFLALFLLSACATTKQKSPEDDLSVIFYPAPPAQPRLQYLYSITTEDDFGEGQSSLDRFLLGAKASEKTIQKPYDVASSNGKIYIMDRMFKKILILDLAKKKMGFINDTGRGALSEPSGIWVTPDELKYVADMERRQVLVYGKDNRYLRHYGDKAMFDKPVDVAVFGDRIYVCDMAKNRVIGLNRDTGDIRTTIGTTGAGEGELYKPTHVVVDSAGNVLVNDAFNFRVQKFDPDGNFIKSYGSLGDSLGTFARPKGLAIDKEGHLYVADAAFENVQIFDDQTGQLLLFLGGAGNKPGGLYLPSAVNIDYHNVTYFKNFIDKNFRVKYLLYVSNMFGSRKLNVYGFGDWLGD